MITVAVIDNNIEQALRRLKKAAATTGLLADIRRHAFYISPSRRRRLKSERARKAARKRARQYHVRLDNNGDPI